MRNFIAIVATLGLALVTSAQAQDASFTGTFYLGTWKFDSAVIAPWADPHKLAASLGFAGSSFKTLETGCESDWHFIDPSTAETGLDDYVYTLKKQ